LERRRSAAERGQAIALDCGITPALREHDRLNRAIADVADGDVDGDGAVGLNLTLLRRPSAWVR
jgi:hypothetical protein